jgi:hypothetical protein
MQHLNDDQYGTGLIRQRWQTWKTTDVSTGIVRTYQVGIDITSEEIMIEDRPRSRFWKEDKIAELGLGGSSGTREGQGRGIRGKESK